MSYPDLLPLAFGFVNKRSGYQVRPVVQKLDSAIHRINHYPLGKYLTKTNLRYSLYSDLPSGQRYPPFEQLGPEFVPLIYLVTML